jgi:hypothetical protein
MDPIRAADINVGDLIDLESDLYADPNHDQTPFEFLFMEVAGVERETPDCVRIDFEGWDSCGFPPDHLLKREPTTEVHP